jgi:hypothetical protein
MSDFALLRRESAVGESLTLLPNGSPSFNIAACLKAKQRRRRCQNRSRHLGSATAQ